MLKVWPLFVIAIILTLLSNQLALMGPRFSGQAIDAISAANGVDFEEVKSNIVKMIICYALSAVLSLILSIIMINISQKIVGRMRTELFEKLIRLPIGFFDATSVGDIVSRMSYDIDTVNTSISHDVVQVMTSIYTVIGSLIFMWNISRSLIIVFVVTVPVSIIFTRYRSKKVRPLFKLRSKMLGELNGYAEEMLSGCRTIQCYNRQKQICKNFDNRNEEAMKAYYNSEYYASAMGPTVNLINNLSISFIMILGGILYMYSSAGVFKTGSLFFISLGGIAQFVQYSRKFAGPINEFANIIHEFQSAFSAAERVFKIIDEEPEKVDDADAKDLVAVKGNVSFFNVGFGYTNDKKILENLSITADKGKTIAIVGPTGAGKTTIINLLMRFYDVNAGNIFIDGIATDKIKRKDLRKAFIMVLQDTWLFNGTVFENIAYGKEDATIDEVIKAAKAAKIHTFIEHLPLGYDTVLSDDGVNISKGQKQLITIARAILSNAPMLILDEATSNVDSRTEIQIQEALHSLMKDRTCFIIAHRLSTIKNADSIIVLQDGKISEQGNHAELIRANGFYSKLYNSQFN